MDLDELMTATHTTFFKLRAQVDSGGVALISIPGTEDPINLVFFCHPGVAIDGVINPLVAATRSPHFAIAFDTIVAEDNDNDSDLLDEWTAGRREGLSEAMLMYGMGRLGRDKGILVPYDGAEQGDLDPVEVGPPYDLAMARCFTADPLVQADDAHGRVLGLYPYFLPVFEQIQLRIPKAFSARAEPSPRPTADESAVLMWWRSVEEKWPDVAKIEIDD